MSLETLPPELYHAILFKVPISFLKNVTLNLSRAIPHSPVPLRPLFESISITSSDQLLQLYRRLKFNSKESGSECTWVKSFTLLEWNVDADVLVNTVLLFSSLEHLNLRIGSVIAPEHLEALFRHQFHSLISLNIRFRPYVKTATYYPFLRGMYFDSLFDCISKWELKKLNALSITQDHLPVQDQNERKFAQPIVFFSFVPLTTLSMSPAIQDVEYLRLNIPSRQPVHHLIASNSTSMFDIRVFPNLASLDLSSCAVHVSDLPLLINCFGKQLRHLILDDTNICNGSTVGEWEVLGKAIALADVAPTRKREKLLKSWIDARSPSITVHHDYGSSALSDNQMTLRSKRGRKGLATATISLRESSNDSTISSSTTIQPYPIPFEAIQHLTGKIRLVPMASHIQSICVNRLSSGMEDSARSEFAKGWLDGSRQLHATWARLQQTQSNGTRLFRFDEQESLTEIGPLGQDKFWDHMTLSSSFNSPPLLCFSGAMEKCTDMNGHHSLPKHPNGCGHQGSANVWPTNFYD